MPISAYQQPEVRQKPIFILLLWPNEMQILIEVSFIVMTGLFMPIIR